MSESAEQFEKRALEQIDLLYRVARRLTHNADEAGDLVQEAYLRAFRARSAFILPERGIRPWLLRILYNLHFTRVARRKRQPVIFESEYIEASQSPQRPSTDAQLDSMDEQLAGALNELPADYRVVLLLWAVEGFSYKEIAESVGVPIGTVMSRLHRARRRMSARLKGYATEHRILPKMVRNTASSPAVCTDGVANGVAI